MEENKVIPFEGNNIRKVWHKEEWWFSIIDVIGVLTENKRPRKYWSDLKKKLHKEGFDETSDLIGQLKMQSSDGKMRKTDAANKQTIFRVIQAVPSKKLEPFKQWLAKLVVERLEEINDPSLAVERAKTYYKALGYSDEWIEKRLQSIDIRTQLTAEWKERGVQEGLEYAILTAEISRGTFGLAPKEYKQLKDLKRENLRDHMNNLELIFTMLGEEQTKQEAIQQDAQGFHENKKAAKEGGAAAGDALAAFEKRTKTKVVTEANFKDQIKAAKALKKPDTE